MKFLKMFKEWYNLAKPKKSYWILQFITVTMSSVCLLLEAYFAARVTTSLVANNYKMAIIQLVIILMIVCIRVLAWDINYRNTTRLIGSSYYNIQDKLFDKIIKSSDKNFEHNSKEKICNIMHNDVYDTATFADSLCSRFRYLVSIILCVGSILFISPLIALCVLVGLIVLYVVITRINEAIAKSKNYQRKALDNEYEMFTQLLESKNIAKEYSLVNNLKTKVREKNKDFFEGRRRHYVAYSHLDNDFLALYKTLIFGITILVMFLLKNNVLTLTIYLTIISYVTDSLTYSSSFYTLFTDFKNSYVSTSRVNIILNFDDRELLELGEIDKNDINGEIDFIKVNYKAQNDEFKTNDLKNVSFHISTKQSVIFKGNRGCGKRTIFYILRRLIDTTSGDVYLDKIKLKDYSEKVYNENINFVLTKPYFFKSTIMDNFKMITKNEKKIFEVWKKVNMYDFIMSLPNTYNTEIIELTQREIYLLGLARVLLFNNEVILVYEFPSYLNKNDIETVKGIFNYLSMSKTIVYFTAGDSCDDLADKIYSVVSGEVKMVKVNPHRKTKMMFNTEEK